MRARPAALRRDVRTVGTSSVLALVALVACGPSERSGEVEVREEPSSLAAREDTLTVLKPGDERVLGPAWDDAPKFLMFLPLVNPMVGPAGYPAVDTSGGDACGRLTGVLAESWEHSPDYRTWTVRLREGVRWHDGEPVTAHDVEFTVELWQHPEVRNYAAAGLDSAVALDDRTVRFFLTRPGRWPVDGWAVFYPEHLLEDLDPAGFYDWEFWTHPVGNGPYRYVRHVPQTMMELEANPDYYRGSPAIDRLVLKFRTAGSGAGLVELRSGNVDLVGQVNFAEAELLERDPRFRVHYRVSSTGEVWLFWNRRNLLFESVRIRRALTRAIDRRTLHRLLRLPVRVPLTDGPYMACQYRRGSLAEPWPHDPKTARALLEEAGWRDADGDGVRERDGREFRFTLTAEGRHRRAAVFVQDQLRRVGVRVELVTLEGTVIRQRLKSGEFEALLHQVGGEQLTQFLAEGSPLGSLPPRMTELAAAGRGEPDFLRKDSIYAELAELFRGEIPGTWLYPVAEAIAAHRRVRGLALPGGETRPGWRWQFGGVEFLWIEEDEP